MPVSVSGISVASENDLRSLERKIDSLTSSIRQLEKNTNEKINEATKTAEALQRQVTTLQTNLAEQKKFADKLETSLIDLEQEFKTTRKNLEQSLEDIGKEVEASADLWEDTNKHLSTTGEIISQIVTSTREQASAESGNRQALTEQMGQFLDRQKNQFNILHQSFVEIQSHLKELVRIETEGKDNVKTSIDSLSLAVKQMQALTEDSLMNVAKGIQEITQGRSERAGDENASFSQLIQIQEQIRNRLEAIHQASRGLASSSEQAETHQKALLSQEQFHLASERNQRAAFLFQRGDYASAALLLEEAVKFYPQDSDVRTNLAFACLKSGQSERAKELLIQILEQDPQAVNALNILGVLHLEQGDAQTALSYLQRATGLTPDDAAMQMNLGKAYYQCGMVLPALAAWKTAQQLEPVLVNEDQDVKILLES